MTSTTFSSKTFPKLYKWTLKRNRAVTVVYGILMVLGIILNLYVMSQMKGEDYLGSSPANEFGAIGYVSIIIAQAGAVAMTYISALITFSFLHNKRSTDMFGSLPTTRGTIYLSHLLGGMTAVSVPFVLGSLIVIGITCRTTEYFVNDLLLVLCGILGMIASYTFTALIAYCCGTTLDTAIIAVAVNAIYAGTIGLFWGVAAEMIPGVDFGSLITTPVLTFFAPYTHCFFAASFNAEGESSAFVFILIWTVIFSAGMTVLGLFAAKKRKSEVAQSEFDVKWLPIAIKAGGSIVCGGLIGSIAALSSSSGYANMVIFAFWYVIMSFAAFFILHIIFQRGLKGRFLPSFIAYISVTVVVLGVIFGMTAGMGIDTYVPAPANVRSVKMDMYTYKDPENIETITEIHKVITEGVKKDGDYPYYLGNSANTIMIEDYDSYETYPYSETEDEPAAVSSRENRMSEFKKKYPAVLLNMFSFEYHKKIGFMTYRTYYIAAYNYENYDCARLEALLEKLYNSEEYKHNENKMIWESELRKGRKLIQAPTLNYNVFSPTVPDYGSYSYGASNSYSQVGSVELPGSEEFVNGLCEAIKQDISADENYFNKRLFMSIASDSTVFGDSFLTINVRYENEPYHGIGVIGGTYFSSYFYDFDVLITDDYTNTLSYLESSGISVDYRNYGSMPMFSTPTSYVENNYAAEEAYYDFGQTGGIASAEDMTRSISYQLEYMGLLRSGAGMSTDFAEWDDKHHRDFEDLVLKKTDELYTEYIHNSEYIRPEYTNSFLSTTNTGGEYFYIADKIIEELDKSCVKMVEDLSGEKI